jgi:hypothetical protein
MNVVGYRISLHDFHPFLRAQLARNPPDLLARPLLQNLLFSVFQGEHDVALTLPSHAAVPGLFFQLYDFH